MNKNPFNSANKTPSLPSLGSIKGDLFFPDNFESDDLYKNQQQQQQQHQHPSNDHIYGNDMGITPPSGLPSAFGGSHFFQSSYAEGGFTQNQQNQYHQDSFTGNQSYMSHNAQEPRQYQVDDFINSTEHDFDQFGSTDSHGQQDSPAEKNQMNFNAFTFNNQSYQPSQGPMGQTQQAHTPQSQPLKSPKTINIWNDQSDKILLHLVKTFKNDWETIAKKFNVPGINANLVKHRFAFLMQSRTRQRPAPTGNQILDAQSRQNDLDAPEEKEKFQFAPLNKKPIKKQQRPSQAAATNLGSIKQGTPKDQRSVDSGDQCSSVDSTTYSQRGEMSSDKREQQQQQSQEMQRMQRPQQTFGNNAQLQKVLDDPKYQEQLLATSNNAIYNYQQINAMKSEVKELRGALKNFSQVFQSFLGQLNNLKKK